MKICKICGKEFNPVRVTQKYCCKACYKKSQQIYQRSLHKTAEDWQPIYSLNCRYEMNQFGDVRNAKTKKILKAKVLKNKKLLIVRVYIAPYKIVGRSIQQLLWETHGILPKIRAHPKVAVNVSNEDENYYFESMKAAARFLSDKVFYSVITIHRYLWKKRLPKIGEWKITYHEGSI